METSTENIGTIVSASGHVYLETESGLILLENGDTISKGAVIITQDDGRVEIRFEDNTTLSQAENSRISIDDYVYDQDDASNSRFLLDMAKGTLRTVTGKIAEQNPDEFKVKSPLATIGIRGTEFWIISNEDDDRVYLGDIAPGHIMVVQDEFGTIRFMNSSGTFAALVRDTPMGPLRVATQEEMQEIQERTPITSLPDTDDTPNDQPGGSLPPEHPEDGPDQNPDDAPSPSPNEEELHGPQAPPLEFSPPHEENGDPFPDDIKNPFSSITDQPFPRELPSPPDDLPVNDSPSSVLFGEDSDDTLLDNELNGAPYAEDLNITVEDATTVTGQLQATDPDGDDLTFAVVHQPEHGTVTISEGGSFVYSPEDVSTTSDSFTYQVTDDEGATDQASVIITFDVNNSPEAEDSSITLDEDSSAAGQLQATDPEEDSLTFILDQNGDHGTATVNTDGTFTYTPQNDYSGSDTFTFLVADDHGAFDTGTVTVSITPVNDTGPATTDQTVIFNTSLYQPIHGSLIPETGSLENVYYSLAGSSSGVDLSLDGTFTYDNYSSYSSPITYTATDSVTGESSTATITLSEVPTTSVEGEDPYEPTIDDNAAKYLQGDSADNSITGTLSDDIIDGGKGNDKLNGMDGNDIFLGSLGDDTITGGDGEDTVDYSQSGYDNRTSEINLADTASAPNALTYNELNGDLSISSDILTAIENVIGSNTHADIITGNDSANKIFGNGGDDELSGGGGNDILHGGDGNDIVAGGAGDDLLFGGYGSDKMTGGAGSDRFLFTSLSSGGDSGDTITDFTSNEDSICFDGAIFDAGTSLYGISGNLSTEHLFTLSGDDADSYRTSGSFTADGNEACFVFLAQTDTEDASLYFDNNGSDSGGENHIVDLGDLADLNSTDIFIIDNPSI